MATNNWADQDGRRVSQNANVPVRSDIEDHLSRMFNDSVGDKLHQMLYKPSDSTSSSRTGAGNPNKAPTNMGNGKDFFAELRKQLTAMADKEKAGG